VLVLFTFPSTTFRFSQTLLASITPTHFRKSPARMPQLSMRFLFFVSALVLITTVHASGPPIKLPVPVLYARCDSWTVSQTQSCVFDTALSGSKSSGPEHESPLSMLLLFLVTLFSWPMIGALARYMHLY
jgi:hypothetical protein